MELNGDQEFSIEELQKIADGFSRLKDFVYFDNAGAAIYHEKLISSVNELLMSNLYCNPHTSRTTENLIEQLRYKILSFVNADPEDEVIFTSGATAAIKIVGESFDFKVDEAFYHLTDSHTSILGLREIVQTDDIIPITRNELLSENFKLQKSGLVALPAQCNFNGFKIPLNVIKKIQENPDNFLLLDAASFLSSNKLDFKIYRPDFVCVSFYKIFGYPDGLGALIVSKRATERLKKRYYGGGTVEIAMSRKNFHVKRENFHERFEDGTIPFLSIIQLQKCFKFMEGLLGDNFVERISRHVFKLAKYLYESLKMLEHKNGNKLIEFYHDTNFDDSSTQSGIVNFNIRHSDQSFVGYAEFSCIASLHNFVIRTGCFCNPGSCQTFLKYDDDELLKQFNAGHVCGDANDLIDGKPTGSIRVSFGLQNTKQEVDKFLKMIKDCYLDNRVEINRKNIETKYRKENAKCRLKSIRIYPIKSCGQYVINGSWTINESGLKYDREWLIIDGNSGVALTQKKSTKMCLIKPSIDETRGYLKLEFPNMKFIEVKLEMENSLIRNGKICETKVCGDRVEGWDCGDKVSEWLSEALEIDNLRLIKHKNDITRKHGSISLANQAQFLLINESSVSWLMDNVEEWENDDKSLENIVDRFRGNFIIENLEPLAENDLKTVKFGDLEFIVEGPCTRCQMICIDQKNGEKTNEPLKTIGKIFKGKMKFGIYLKHSSMSPINVKCGDEIFYTK